jgi:carboxypeptidase PM20D1
MKSTTTGAGDRAPLRIDISRAAEHLAGAIRFRTISYQDPARVEKKEFLALHAYLAKTYPGLHRSLKRERVNDLSLLYTWKGSDEKAEPILLMAHLDVVPVENHTEASWTHPPFSGRRAGGFIWGRGSLDVKNGVVGIMESVEFLLKSGFRPRRSVYLAFGHDEEVLGNDGAAEISRLLARRGVRLAYALDEGGFIRTEVMPGVSRPAAMIGIAEKGYLTLDLTVRGAGGHSSMPQRRSAVGRLAAALCRLEKNRFPARLTEPVRSMFECLGAEAAAPYRYAYKNIRLIEPLLMGRIAADPQSDAMIRTTMAPTMLKGSDKENMIPVNVSAAVNFRILQGETRESVIGRVRRVIDDPEVAVSARDNSSDPSPVSDMRSPEYAALKNIINALFPDAVVTPFLMVGATDSRHFAPLSGQVFRFTPAHLDNENMKLIHGTNERISERNFAEFIAFYTELIRRTAG